MQNIFTKYITYKSERSGYEQKFEEKMLLYLCPSNPLNLDEKEQKQNKLAFFLVRSA